MADLEKKVVVALERLMHNGKVVEIEEEIEVFVQDVERLVDAGLAKLKGSRK